MPAAAARRGARARCGGWRVETFLRVGCAGLARVDFFVEGERVLVNELNTMPGFTATSVLPEAVGGTGVPFPPSCATGCSRSALERYRAERARPRVLALGVFARTGAISEISTRSWSGRQLRDPDEVVAVALAAGVELEALVLAA